MSDVASGYLQLLELDQERDIAERTLESRRATLALARSRFRQGVASELDVRQFEAQMGAPAVTLPQVDRLRAQQEHRLNVLVGERPRPVARDRSLAEAAAALDVPDSLSSALLTRRADVRQAERAYTAATARIGVAEAARLPTMTISGFYGLQARSLPKLFSNPGDGYSLQAGGALVSVRTTRDEVAALETQVAALRRALHLAELRYRTGISNYLEVLDAQRSLFGAEIALRQGHLRQLTPGVQLYRALGGRWTR